MNDLAFTGTVLTAKGLALQNKVQTGVTLGFTKMKIGDGTLSSGFSLEALTDLISPKMTLSISSVAVVGDGTSRIRSVVTNTGLSAGFFVREIGVFATDPDEGEILYCVANAGNECDYLPTPTSVAVEQTLDVVTAVGNATSVTATINETIVLATIADITDHNNGSDAHGLHRWKAARAYAVGDICFSKLFAVSSYKYFECIVAGTSSTTEPTWPSISSTVTDGSVTWIVRDLRQGASIGNIVQVVDVGGGKAGLPAISGALLMDISGIPIWEKLTAYEVGAVRYTMAAGHEYKRFECVVAGTSGATEPSWTAVGTLVTDNTVTWIVDDVRDGTPVGRVVLEHLGSPRVGYIKSNGTLVSRTEYPRLWVFALASGLIVTEAEWTAGKTGAFSTGDTLTTFRLPDLRGVFERGWDDSRGIDKTAFTGNVTIGSNSITAISVNTAILSVGMPISGTGIPAGATIAAIVSASSIAISTNATVTTTGVTLTVIGRVLGAEQADDNKGHQHIFGGAGYMCAYGSSYEGFNSSYYPPDTRGTTMPSGGPEARPRNIAKLACIKY